MKSFGLRVWSSPTLTSWMSLVIRIFSMGLVLPLVLKTLSVEEINVWLIFSTVFNLVTIIDFGFSPTFIRCISYSKANGREVSRGGGKFQIYSIDEVIVVMKFVYSKLGLISFFFITFIGSAFLWMPISRVSDHLTAWISWVVIIMGSITNLRAIMYSSYIQGSDLIATLRRCEIGTGLLTLILMLIVLMNGGNLFFLAIASQFGSFSNLIINSKIARAVSPPNSWSKKKKPNYHILKKTWSSAWRSGLGVVMTFGTIQAIALIYAQLGSAAEVASYLFSVQIIQAITLLANVPFYSIIPRLSRYFAEGKLSELVIEAKLAMRKVLLLFCFGVVVTALTMDLFLNLINSKIHFVTLEVWTILVMAMLFHRVGAMYLQVYTLTDNVVWHFADGVAGLIIILVFPLTYKFLGLMGVPLSFLVGFAGFYFPFSLYKYRQYFGDRTAKVLG